MSCQDTVTITSTNNQDPSYDLRNDSLSFVSVPLVAPIGGVYLQPCPGGYLLPALVRHCTQQMQRHIRGQCSIRQQSRHAQFHTCNNSSIARSKYMHNRIT